jgi:hypothetical protein
MGLICPGDYRRTIDPCVWGCKHNAKHKFTASLKSLKQLEEKMGRTSGSKHRAPAYLCIYCDVEECEFKWPIIMEDEIIPHSLTRSSLIEWKCFDCGEIFACQINRLTRGCTNCGHR